MLCRENRKTGTHTFQQLWSRIWQHLVEFHMYLPFHPAIVPLENHPQRTGKCIK